MEMKQSEDRMHFFKYFSPKRIAVFFSDIYLNAVEDWEITGS